MLGNIMDYIRCPVCGEGNMRLSVPSTFETYSNEFDLNDVDKIEEGIIGYYWVFECLKCETRSKLNFKEIERIARKTISHMVLSLKAKGELDKTVNMKVKYLIYCGDCTGYDSDGSCPEQVYNECQLRRMPGGL